jgi:hypothetical protein
MLMRIPKPDLCGLGSAARLAWANPRWLKPCAKGSETAIDVYVITDEVQMKEIRDD